MVSLNDIDSQLTTWNPGHGVVCCDSDGTIISWDIQAEKLFGWQPADALGKKLFELILPGNAALDGKSTLSSFFNHAPSAVPLSAQIECTVTHRNGTPFSVEITISFLPGGSHFTIFIRNLQGPENQSEAVSNGSFKLGVINAILQMSLETTVLKDRLTAILAYILSLKKLDLLPRAALFLVEQDTKTLVLKVHQGFKTDQIRACRQVPFGQCYCGKAALSNTLQYVSRSSKKHLVQGNTPHGHYCVPLTKLGLVTGVLCLYVDDDHQRSPFIEDILHSISQVIAAIIEHQKMDLQLTDLVSDLRTSLADLREEQKFSDSIIQSLEHGLLVCNKDGTIHKSNEAAKNILQPFATEIQGRSLTDIIGGENARRVLFLEGGRQPREEHEITLRLANGGELILRYSIVSRNNAKGDDAGTIVSLTDVSEWRYVRKEMEKMNRLSTVAEIASAVAHEVRNPLAGIKIMAQSIEENSGREEEHIECAQRIIRQVDRLNELLTDFFSYARPVTPKKQPTSLENILSETKPLIINKLVKQRIYLLEDFEKGLPPVVADPNQVQQVFLNLFLNAIDAIKQGGMIEITAHFLNGKKLASYRKKNHLPLKGSRYVSVIFKDNGSGMSKNGAEKVFEPFYTTKTNGSGLGMSIVYRTLKENDAFICVDSAEGKGTTYTMFFKPG